MYRWNLTAPCLMMLALFAAGCGNDGISSMKGTVTVDGNPAPAGLLITFDPVEKGVRDSWGETDENGEYYARYSLQRDGIAEGECVARLTTPDEDLPMEGEELKLKYPSKYYTELKKFTVEPGRNTVDFEISTTE